MRGASAAGSRYDGGAGEDLLQLVGNGNLDLSRAVVRSIETLAGSTFSSTLVVSLKAAQLNGIRDFDLGEVVALTTGGAAEISGLLRASEVRLANIATDFDFSAATAADGSTQSFFVRGGTASDTITGGARADRIAGGDGADSLVGGAGNDTLFATAFFVDGSGADTLSGGGGDDTYYVDSADDVIQEKRSGGVDHVNAGGFGSEGAYTMGANLESMTILSVSGLSGPFLAVGNSGANTITGSGFGSEQIRGGGGADTLDGGTGSSIDTVDYGDKRSGILVSLNGDVQVGVEVGGAIEDLIRNFRNVIGGSGDDRITGDGLANVLDGGASADTLSGGVGDDTLIGGAGADRLAGGAGSNMYVFRAASESSTGGGVDTITAFRADDLIDLSAIDARTGGSDDAFIFANAPTNAAGRLYVVYDAGADVSTVYGNVDAGPADLVIKVNGTIGADDFLL